MSEELSGRMVIESICELNGAFGHINRDGLFEYITLPTSDSLTYPHYVNNSCAYEDYETEAITGVRAINVDGDSGTIVGTEDNMYIMQSNILTFGSEGTQDLEDALDNLLDLISEFTYTPFKVTTYGNPMLPLGTNVTFETKYKTINSFVMTRFLSGIQALRDTFTALGDRKYPEDVNRIKNEIQRSAGQTHKLINDVNTLDSEIFDEQGNSRIQQTLSEVVLKVDSQGNVGTIALGVTPDPTSQDPSERVTQVDINADFLKFKANTQLDLEAAKLNITSDNFTLDEDGNLTCNNATMTNADIGGKVTASSGEIGPYIIDSTGLRATVGNFYASLTPGQIGVHNGSRGAYFTPNSIDFNQWTGALITGTHINFNNPTDSSTTLGDAFLGKKDGVYWNAANVASIDAGYLMHGKGTGHYYACNWTGSRLDFYVDVTNVGYVSDRRLKNEIQEVDANLIKAICECKTYQYKAFNRGGLISVGIIAQDFVSNCKKYGIEPMEYEVCQKTIFKADDDTEYYTIEYSQYLTLKSIHLQNQIDELKELTKK